RRSKRYLAEPTNRVPISRHEEECSARRKLVGPSNLTDRHVIFGRGGLLGDPCRLVPMASTLEPVVFETVVDFLGNSQGSALRRRNLGASAPQQLGNHNPLSINGLRHKVNAFGASRQGSGKSKKEGDCRILATELLHLPHKV